jgi:acyl dehydratase
MGLFAVGETNKMLDAWAGRTTYTANSAVWVKLHLGDPGAAGANNAAANTTRQQVTFGAAAAAGAMSNTAVVEWLSVSNTETYSHVSFWTANAAGTFLGSDDLSSTAPVTAGDTFRIPVGDLDLALPGV